MPVRSSVCTYSPSTVSSSKHPPNSLSIGHYKPLSSSSYLTNTSSYRNDSLSSSTKPSSTKSSRFQFSSSSPLTSSYTPSSGYSSSSIGSYRPLTSSSSSTGSSSIHASRLASTSLPHYSRYSSASSTSSSISSASIGSDYSSSLSVYSSTYNHSPSSPSSYTSLSSSASAALRRLSHSSQISSSDGSSTVTQALPSEVPKGLTNLGNTCYMNAVIQSLYSISAFRNLILRSYHGKSLTSGLNDLFKTMKSSSGSQDAQEFLRYLINGVHEELNLASRRSRRSPLAGKSPKTANEAWTQYRDIVDDSPLVDIVVGQLCSTIICSVCQNKSLCWDPFWDLSLPLSRRRHSCNLSDVMADFTAKETLDSDERPICETCKKATKSTKQISVCRLPQVMILHLKKFTNDGYKLTSPEVKIDRMLPVDGCNYHLTACISHHGHSSSSGHYTSHCKYSSSWFHFNDDRVKDVTSTFNSAKLSDAYVLFYTQQLQSSKATIIDDNASDTGGSDISPFTGSPNTLTNQSRL